MNYHIKYLKYKKKYLNLQKMIGNGLEEQTVPDSNDNIKRIKICETNRTIKASDLTGNNNGLMLKDSDCFGSKIITTGYSKSRQLILGIGPSWDKVNFIPDVDLFLSEHKGDTVLFTSNKDLSFLIGNFISIETKSSYNVIEQNKPKKIYSIEGNIGTGKSTVIETLRNQDLFKTVIIEEPIGKWDTWFKNFSEASSHKKKDFVFGFQLIVLKSYFDQIVNHRLNGYTIISERTPATGKHIFLPGLIEAGLIRDDELRLYESFFNTIGYYPDIVYYLKVDPETSYKRGRNRGRFEELTPIFMKYEDFKEKKDTDIEVMLFREPNDQLWKDKYTTLELDESENSEYKKVNLTDLVDNIVTKLGEEPSLKKGDWIEISYNNKKLVS